MVGLEKEELLLMPPTHPTIETASFSDLRQGLRKDRILTRADTARCVLREGLPLRLRLETARWCAHTSERTLLLLQRGGGLAWISLK